MAKGKKKNGVAKTKGKQNPKRNNKIVMKSPTGNLMNILNVRSAQNVNGMKDYPYLYRTELR